MAFVVAASGTLRTVAKEPVVALDPGSTGNDLAKLAPQMVDGPADRRRGDVLRPAGRQVEAAGAGPGRPGPEGGPSASATHEGIVEVIAGETVEAVMAPIDG